MANHKTKINGTEYAIKGGKTKVGGTVYAIKKGKTKVNGTGYDINFGGGDMCEVTINNVNGLNANNGMYLSINGTTYYHNSSATASGTTYTVQVPKGSTIPFYYAQSKANSRYFTINGVNSTKSLSITTKYSHPITTNKCTINMAIGSSSARIVITDSN